MRGKIFNKKVVVFILMCLMVSLVVCSTGFAKSKKKKKKRVYAQPEFFACLEEYDRDANLLEVDFYNGGDKPVYVVGGISVRGETNNSHDRKIKQTRKKVAIYPNCFKTVGFKVKGKKTYYDIDYLNVFYKFKYDGKKYKAKVTSTDSFFKSGFWRRTYQSNNTRTFYNKWADWGEMEKYIYVN